MLTKASIQHPLKDVYKIKIFDNCCFNYETFFGGIFFQDTILFVEKNSTNIFCVIGKFFVHFFFLGCGGQPGISRLLGMAGGGVLEPLRSGISWHGVASVPGDWAAEIKHLPNYVHVSLISFIVINFRKLYIKFVCINRCCPISMFAL